MDANVGLATRTLKRAMVMQRSLIPEDADAIDRLFSYLKQTKPTMVEIREAVCEFYAVSRGDFESATHRAIVVIAKHVFCYFAHRYGRASLHQIKTRCGYLDHSSVHYGVHRIERLAITQPLMRDDLDLVRLRICEKLLTRDCRGQPS